MNPEHYAEFAKLLAEAAETGRPIQRRHPDGEWVAGEWIFDLDPSLYRVQPEPKYRPFTDEELKEQVGNRVRSKHCDDVHMVAFFSNGDVCLAGVGHVSADTLFNNFVYHPEGEPCGVCIE